MNNLGATSGNEMPSRLVPESEPESVHLTFQIVADILGVPLPEELELVADHQFNRVATGVFPSTAGDLYFVRSKRLAPRVLQRLARKGVAAFVARTPVKGSKGRTYPTLIVPDGEDAYIKTCQWVGKQYSSTKIAVTGSIGKTTTKELIQSVSSARYVTLYNKANENGIGQVGRYIQKQTSHTQVLIQETGAGKPGLVRSAAQMLLPDAFVVTNIGLDHIESYGGKQENVLADKLSLDEYLPAHGVAFINFEDPKLRELPLRHRIISYALDNSGAHYYAENIEEADGELRFDAVDRLEGSRHPLKVHSFGRHNVLNAMAAFAVGRWLSIPIPEIRAGLLNYRAEGFRQQLAELGDQRVLVDTYNASEMSSKGIASALQTITPGPGGSRYLVFADMDKTVGDLSEDVHRRVGKEFAIQDGVAKYFLLGEDSKWIVEELEKAGKPYFHTEDRDSLHQAIQEELSPGDVLAFKGGQHMVMGISVDRLFGTAFILEDGQALRNRGDLFTKGGFEFRSVREFGATVHRISADTHSFDVEIPSHIEHDGISLPVRIIGSNVAAWRRLRSIRIPAPVQTLADEAFLDTHDLEAVELAPTLKLIGKSAFENCVKLEKVTIPDGVTNIGTGAFRGCSRLQVIHIPASVKHIGAGALSGCPEVRVVCEPGSYAEQWAAKEGIPALSI